MNAYGGRVVKFHYPRPPDGATIHEMDPPVRVTFDWPISGSFKPRMDGLAIGWWGGRDGYTLVRLDRGGEGWVASSSVQRVDQ